MDSVNNVSSDHEYILCYGKQPGRLNGVQRTFDGYSNPDSDPRGPWIADNLSAGKPGGNTFYPIVDPNTGNKFWPPKGRYWPYSPETMLKKISEGRIIFPKNNDGSPLLKRFQREAKSNVIPISTWGVDQKSAVSNSLVTALNSAGTKEIKELFGDKLFTFPKPTQLIKSLLLQCCQRNDIVFDFFAGSGTTADAVLQLNAEDGGNRKFIIVQLAEKSEPNSEAFKAGYPTLAEICKERIRRSAKKITEGKCNESWNKDTGFRVFKIDSSNMKEVYYRPDDTTKDQLDFLTDNIKDDRTEEDLLFQVLQDWGVYEGLSLPIRKEVIQGKTVFFVDGNTLVACFDKNLKEEFVKNLTEYKPLRVVFRDSGFASDAVKINVDQIFKQISPDTEVRSI